MDGTLFWPQGGSFKVALFSLVSFHVQTDIDVSLLPLSICPTPFHFRIFFDRVLPIIDRSAAYQNFAIPCTSNCIPRYVDIIFLDQLFFYYIEWPLLHIVIFFFLSYIWSITLQMSLDTLTCPLLSPWADCEVTGWPCGPHWGHIPKSVQGLGWQESCYAKDVSE